MSSPQSPPKPRPSTSVPSPISPTSSTDGNVSPLLPPFVPRPPMSRLATANSHSNPHNRSGIFNPQASVADVAPMHAFRLLMPTVRPTRLSATSTSRTPSAKLSPTKHSKSRGASLAPSLQPSPDPSVLATVSVNWIGPGRQFEVVDDQLELQGFQLYAVEKWVVDRNRPVTVLTVFTGDPSHKITVTALSPLSSLTQLEAQVEWEKAIHQLREDGARPKETEKGVIMATSLANFPSNFTIVHIASGNYLESQEQLYTNINVLRMGCSGRSALTLEEPSDTTKDRFISAYHMPDKRAIRLPHLFNAHVLELVKLIQAALSLCGLFDFCRDEIDGLLCDATREGLRRWVTDIGEPCMNLEPSERVADPAVVAALFSMVLSMRNRLQAMGHWVPKDPFIDPITFIKALTVFGSDRPHSHAHTLSLPHHFATSNINISPFVSPAPTTSFQPIYLTQQLIECINAAYDKAKQNESYKVHRVLISKLDDLATDLRTNPDPGGSKGLFGWASSLNPTTDLGKFVKTITEHSRDGSASLKYLWTGRPGEVVKRRRDKEAVMSEGEEKERERERGREIEKEERDRIERERERDKDVKSSEDEADFMSGLPWSGRMQRKIESWAVLGKGKKPSTDLSSRGKGVESPWRGQSAQSSLPSVIVSREPADDDDILTSGQVSPVSDSQMRNPFLLGVGNLPRAERSAGELSDYDRKVTEFNQRNPPGRPSGQTRVVSWADPQTARDALDDEDGKQRRVLSPSPHPTARSSRETSLDTRDSPKLRQTNFQRLKRWRSFNDLEELRGTRILPTDRMQIDIELCGQLLMMRRREDHMANVIACLKAVTSTLSTSNSSLRQEYNSKLTIIEALHARAGVLQDIEAARAHADAMTQETNALAYESAQFLVDDLWHMAASPRQKVLTIRERVFGTGRRLPQGVNGAHGRFNRVQLALDGSTRLVNAHGRTESEAEEEAQLPWIRPVYREEDEGDVIEHANLKPTWLLRFFNYWGSKWGVSKTHPKEKDAEHDEQTKGRAKSSSVAASVSTLELRSTLVRNNTA